MLSLAPVADPGPGPALRLLAHLDATGRLTPDGIAAALQQHPQLRITVLHEVSSRWGSSGVQALIAAEDRARTVPTPMGTRAAPAHNAATHQVAERDGLNAVITVVARAGDGRVVARWRARGHWVGQLPARYHGTHASAAWTWTDPAARETRLHTRADGSGGVLVESWAAQHGAVTVDVVADSVDTAAPDETSEADGDVSAAGPATSGDHPVGMDPLVGLDPEHQRIVAEFERELGLDPDRDADDDTSGQGAPGGDPHGRTGADTAIGGEGPGGQHARAGGDHEGSITRGLIDGSRHGSALGVEGGSPGGRFGGEGKAGDDGVRGAGAIAGGVIAIPTTVKGVVEIVLLADAGDVTGMGANLFTRLGKRVASVSAAALREVIAREARVACERELRATIQKMARSATWRALSAEERVQAVRIAYFELQRAFLPRLPRSCESR